MPTASMVFDVLVADRASGSFKAMSKEASGASLAFDKLGKAAAGISVVFAAFAVNEAAKFESAMTRISTQAGVPIQNIKALGDAVLKLAPKVGSSPDDLANSLYHVESAFRTTGITAGKAIDIVKQAAELSKIGNADLGDTTQAIIGVLASGIKGVKDATDAAAQLNQLVGAGDTTLQKVADAIATGILPVSANLGLSFKDVGAALATLTDNVTPADEAATRLRTSFSLLEKGSGAGKKALESIGITSTELGDDFRKPDGLLVALEDVKKHLNDTALTATQKSQLILTAFGGAKSGATFLTLYNELDRLKSKYSDFGTAAQAANKFQEAWNNQQATFKQKLDDLRASWDVFLIKAGNAILPTLKAITDFLSKHPALLHDAALGVLAFAGAWAFLKVANLIGSLGTLAGKIAGVGSASRNAAGDVAALDAAAAGGKTGGAAGSVEALGGAFARSGLILGGAAVLGVGAIALSIKEMFDDTVKGLPSMETLAKLISGGGLTGKGTTEDIGLALSSVSSGDNRKESDTAYLQRTLGSDPGKAAGLSFSGLTKILETGTRPAFDSFLASYRQVEFALHGSPATIQKVDDYLTALYDRINSARAASHDLNAEQTKAASAAALLSTNVDKLSKTYGVNRGQAALLALANKNYNSEVALGKSELDIYGTSLDKNTHNGQENIQTIKDQIGFTKQHAEGIAKLTGNQTLASQAFMDGIKTLEANAIALGFNKTDADKLIDSLIGVKNNANIDIVVTAKGTFDWTDPAQQQAYISQNAPFSPAAAFYAAGGIEDHRAHIANKMRVFAEPETGGEAYIPLSPAKRARSLGIWAETGKRLGVSGLADGGILAKLAAGVPAYAGSEVTDLSQHMAATWKAFAAKKLADLEASSGSAGGGAAQWAPLVLQVLGMIGQSASWLPNVLRQINTESGGNPNAINNWDSNAAIGQNSRGLLQTVPGTFAAYAGQFAGLGIFNPLANIYAALRYALSRYGSLGILGQGHGYAMGTSSAQRGWAKVGERGAEWVNFGGGERVLPHGQQPPSAPTVHVEHLHLPDTTSVDGFAAQVAMRNHAYAMARRV